MTEAALQKSKAAAGRPLGNLPLNGRRRLLVQYIICTGAFLSNLSAGLFNIALVDIAHDFGVNMAVAQWVVTVYLLVISVLLPIMGRLGDTFGRRTVHNLGYFCFALGALCCALAPSLGWLLAFRAVQGVGASMYQATNMALIVSVFPPEKRGKALGLISTFVAAGSMIGPSLGGVLIQWFSWETSFWLLAGAALLAWGLAQRFIPKDPPVLEGRIDATGAFLFAAALAGLVTAINLGSAWGWFSPAVLALLLLFAAGAAGFAAWCLSSRWEARRVNGSGGAAGGRIFRGRASSPFIDLRLLADGAMNTGIWITIVTYMAAFSAQLVLPVFLRSELGIPPALAGLIMMGYPLALIVASPVFGSWSDKLGPLPLLAAGLLTMGGVLAVLGFLTPAHPLLLLIALIVLLGISMGMITSPNNSLVMGRAGGGQLGLISSLLALSRNLGMMFGTAAGGALLTGGAGNAGDWGKAGTNAAGGAGTPGMAQTAGAAQMLELAGFHTVFAICLVLVLFSLLLLLFTVRQGRHRRKETVSSKI
ncbi:MFS transporter [Paenibacillus macerans]|uniref:MFS transporter n=1 Tax=Paenibacillus macerans TaxID=44252 RepID=UPI0022E5E586|nr:MFS transporter [Paenibacillus macerans]MEC0140181.1 MFS transporter [Paenibacillus macerans]